MGYILSTDDYFTYESRLASFRKAQTVSRRRGSNTTTKGPRSLKWPHKFLFAQDLAKAGFFYFPSQLNPDNVVCFLCHKSLDGWEETDDPFVEHLRHSPNCGWAITATIERFNQGWSKEHPQNFNILEARKATFSDKWPHEGKKGWRCHVKQMIEAGWRYTPTPDSDDMVTCNYCTLSLSDWEKNDKPYDKHYEQSPDCPFFMLMDSHSSKADTKKTYLKRSRSALVSRSSVLSNLTICSDGSREASLVSEDEDSNLTTVSISGKKMVQEKKKPPGKGRRTRAKKIGATEVVEHNKTTEKAQELNRDRKRTSEESQSAQDQKTNPLPKRRITRSCGGVTVDHTHGSRANLSSQRMSKLRSRKPVSTLNDSLMKVTTPMNDSDIERVLEADLDQPISEDEVSDTSGPGGILDFRKTNFNSEHAKVDDELPKSEFIVTQQKTKPQSRPREAKSKLSNKNRTTQKVDEIDFHVLNDQISDQQGIVEHNHSMVKRLTPSIAPEESLRTSTRQATRKRPVRMTRASTISMRSDNSSMVATSSTVEVTKNSSNTYNKNTTALPKTIIPVSQVEGLNDQLNNGKNSSRIVKEAVQTIENLGSNSASPISFGLTKGKYQTEKREANTTYEVSHAPSSIISVDDLKDKEPIKPDELEKEPVRRSKDRLSPDSSQRTALSTSRIGFSEVNVSTSPIRKPPKKSKTITPERKEVTSTNSSPPSSDAENKPPSLKFSTSDRNIASPLTARKMLIIKGTPIRSSPCKDLVFGGLQSNHPWTTVDADLICLNTPSFKSSVSDMFGSHARSKITTDDLVSPGRTLERISQLECLTSMEKKMTVEEWIHYNAKLAEEKLKMQCEHMVTKFEREGTRAIRALEGIKCIE